MAERLQNNAMYSIPDDLEHSTYRFIIVAAKRARQLQSGARPFLPTPSKKATVTSMEEVRRGLVKYWLFVPPKCDGRFRTFLRLLKATMARKISVNSTD